jgi:hypothetical protein
MKKYFVNLAVVASVMILVGGIYSLGCSKKKGINPSDPKEYYAYFGDTQARNTYFRYSTSTLKIDTFSLPYDSYNDGFGISPDGKIMYLHPDDGIVEVSLDSFKVTDEHPIDLPKGGTVGPGHEVIISPDNRYLAVLNRYLHLVDLTDFSVIYSDTSTTFLNGWFANDSRSFFCAAEGVDRYELLQVGLEDSIEVILNRIEDGSVSEIITSPDGDLRFMLLYIGYGTERFQVREMPADSLVFEKVLCPAAGDLAITPDGRYVVYSQPGTMQMWCPPWAYITIFNVAANLIEREVFFFDSSTGTCMGINELWISPDGRHLVGIADRHMGSGDVFHYNLMSHKIEAQLDGLGYWSFSLRGQRRP